MATYYKEAHLRVYTLTLLSDNRGLHDWARLVGLVGAYGNGVTRNVRTSGV